MPTAPEVQSIASSRVLPFSVFECRSREMLHSVGIEDEVVDILMEWSMCVAHLKPDDEDTPYINVVDAKHYLQNWVQVLEHNDPQLLMQPRGMKVDKVVDVQEFSESREYLGQSGSIWRSTRDSLWEIFHGKGYNHYVEVVLGGSIGAGKSYRADLAQAYIVYNLSCYHAPQVDFGLAPGSSIIFILQSAKLTLARQVLFGELGAMLRASPYFTKVFPYNTKVLSELRFPKNITLMPVSSATSAALGMNVFAASLDEANFQKRVKGSKITQFTGEANFDQAQKLYTTLFRRMKSRFAKHGKIPGKFFLISSANYPGDFLDRRIRASKQDDTIYVSTLSLWEAKPPGDYSDDTFLVEVGDSARQSRIIDSGDIEDAVDPDATFIRPPVDFRQDFEDDIDASIRDIGGIPVGARNQFFRERSRIAAAVKWHKSIYDGKQLFTVDRVDLSRIGNLSGLLNQDFLEQIPAGAVYACHLDLSLTGDSAGLAFSRQDGIKQVDARMVWDESLRRYKQAKAGAVPVVSVDGAIAIDPPVAGEIDIEAVTSILLMVNSIIPVKWFTADQFQSAGSLQRAKKKGIATGRLSVDSLLAPYFEFKHAARDGRLILCPSLVLDNELQCLIWDPAKQKIDHEPRSLDDGTVIDSKDVADAVVGSAYTIFTRRSAYKEPATAGGRRRNRRAVNRSRSVKQHNSSNSERTTLRSRLRRRRVR